MQGFRRQGARGRWRVDKVSSLIEFTDKVFELRYEV